LPRKSQIHGNQKFNGIGQFHRVFIFLWELEQENQYSISGFISLVLDEKIKAIATKEEPICAGIRSDFIIRFPYKTGLECWVFCAVTC